MKKTYSKPGIVYEDFSLTTNIAACAVQANYAQEVCGVDFVPGLSLFNSGVAGCTLPVEDGSDEANGVCYHNPSEFVSAFISI